MWVPRKTNVQIDGGAFDGQNLFVDQESGEWLRKRLVKAYDDQESIRTIKKVKVDQ